MRPIHKAMAFSGLILVPLLAVSAQGAVEARQLADFPNPATCV